MPCILLCASIFYILYKILLDTNVCTWFTWNLNFSVVNQKCHRFIHCFPICLVVCCVCAYVYLCVCVKYAYYLAPSCQAIILFTCHCHAFGRCCIINTYLYMYLLTYSYLQVQPLSNKIQWEIIEWLYLFVTQWLVNCWNNSSAYWIWLSLARLQRC